jgi:hypothetical protein
VESHLLLVSISKYVTQHEPDCEDRDRHSEQPCDSVFHFHYLFVDALFGGREGLLLIAYQPAWRIFLEVLLARLKFGS